MKYYFIRVGIILRKILPEFVAYLLTIIVVNLAYPFLRNRKKIIKENLVNLGTYNKRLVKRTFINFALDYKDFLAIPSMTRQKIQRIGRLSGFLNLDKALALKKGVIFVTAHLGSWDLGACFLTSLGYETVAITESAGAEKMYKLYNRFRAKTGMDIISLGQKDSIQRSLKALRDGKILVLFGDRDITKNGIEVNFLGTRTCLPKGPALLSLKTGATIVTAFFVRENGKYIALVEPVIKFTSTNKLDRDIEALTQIIAQRLERKIRTHPTQWYVFDMEWKHRKKQ